MKRPVVLISLLPPELKARRRAHRQRLAVAGLYFLVVLILSGCCLYLLASTRMLESERERVAAQRLQLERQMAASRHWEKKLDEVYRLRALLLQAMGRPADWSALLAGLGRSVPEGVCVTALRCEQASGSPTGEPKTPSTGGKTVIVTGYAVSHREVAALLDALQAAANLREVRCQYSTAEEINERRLTKYEIRVVLPPATPYRPPLEGGEVR